MAEPGRYNTQLDNQTRNSMYVWIKMGQISARFSNRMHYAFSFELVTGRSAEKVRLEWFNLCCNTISVHMLSMHLCSLNGPRRSE